MLFKIVATLSSYPLVGGNDDGVLDGSIYLVNLSRNLEE